MHLDSQNVIFVPWLQECNPETSTKSAHSQEW